MRNYIIIENCVILHMHNGFQRISLNQEHIQFNKKIIYGSLVTKVSTN